MTGAPLKIRLGQPVYPDTQPDPFSFTPVTGVALGSTQTSDTITPVGYSAPAPISVTGGSYSINGGGFTTSGGTINSGDTVTARQVASGGYSTDVNTLVNIGGVVGTFTSTTISDPNALGPASSWNGTAGSGYSDNGGSGAAIPTQGTRTTAHPMPALKSWTDPGQRFSANALVGCESDCYGSVQKVEIYCEGAFVTILNRTRNDDPRPDNPAYAKRLPGFWTTLELSQFTSKMSAGAFGQADIYFKSYPNNASLQPIVIGPFRVTLSSNAYDHRYTVGPSTGTYATLNAALTQAHSDGAKHPEFRIVDSGSFDWMQNGAPDCSLTSYGRVYCAPGVTATLVRTTNIIYGLDAFTPGCVWTPNNPMQFEGGSLTLDLFNVLQVFGGPHRFYGCNVTDSFGPFSSYWGTGTTGGVDLKPKAGFLFGGYVSFCTVSNLQGALDNTDACYKNFAHNTMYNSGNASPTGGAYGYAMFYGYNYIKTHLTPDQRWTQPQVTVTYSGASTVATIVKTGADFVLTTDAGVVATITCANSNTGTSATGPHYTIASLITAINAVSGFSAVGSVWNSTMSTYSLGAYGPGQITGVGGQSLTTQNASSLTDLKLNPITFFSNINYHADFWHISGGQVGQNILIIGNQVQDFGFFNPLFLEGEARDFVAINNAWWTRGSPYYPGNGGTDGYQAGGLAHCDHGVFRNFSYWPADNHPSNGGFNFQSPINGTTFMEVSGFAGLINSGFPTMADVYGMEDSYVNYQSGNANFSSAPNSGVVGGQAVDLTTALAIFDDPSNGSFLPINALLSNLKTSRVDYDMNCDARSATDSTGAVSVNSAGPVPPLPF